MTFERDALVPPEPRQIIRSTLPLKLRWVVAKPDRFKYRPLVYDGFILGRSHSTLTIFDPKTGKELWSDPAGYFFGPSPNIALSGDKLAFTSDRDAVLKVANLSEMKLMWSEGTGGLLSVDISSLALDENAVYVSKSSPAVIYAYDLHTGKPLWTLDKGDWSLTYHLFARGDELYVFNGSSLFILNIHTGAVRVKVENKFTGRTFKMLDDTVYQGYSDKVTTKSLRTGETLWELPRKPGRCLSLDDVVDERVYASFNCSGLMALDRATGHQLWETQFPARIDSKVVAVGDVGYVILADGSIVGFDLGTGAEVGRLETKPSTTTPYFLDKGLAADGTSLYAAFGDNQLFAFGN